MVTDIERGFVLTNGHVVIDPANGSRAETCQLGFVQGVGDTPVSFYQGDVEMAIFDPVTDLDFAVLRIMHHLSGPPFVFSSYVKVNAFASVEDAVTVFGFPSGQTGLTVTEGSVTGFSRGTVLTDVPITAGFSGAPATDGQHRLIGLATRVRYVIDAESGEEGILDYGLGDILSLINWTDGAGADHRTFMHHDDDRLFSSSEPVIRDEQLGCSYLVRTAASPAVYCLLTGDRRLVFPDERTFFSWFPDYSEVLYISDSDLARYRLIGAVTYRPGSLVKIISDPKVYVVIDSFGTLRWIPDEIRARELFGEGWIGTVHDVPDAFFPAYEVSLPLSGGG
ncbi:hypothetical protein AMJ57_05640 [Parcubacteria bacterium SG8_24]|nr:MAG: hypothetical protein AMJ57_05640 [Parcubacteria bacterium SG8_24]